MDRLLQDVIDILPVGVWVADAKGRLVRHNPAAERIWHGLPRENPDQLDRYTGWWADSGKPIAASDWGLMRALREGKAAGPKLVRIQRFDGTLGTIMSTSSPLFDEGGALTGAVAIHEDVTALQESEQRWRQRDRLMRTALELLPVGVWVLGADGRIVLANPAATRIWGNREWQGLADFSAFKAWPAGSETPIASDDWAVMRALREGITAREELLRIETPEGVRRTVISWAAPILGESGEITGAIALNEDVSPLYRTQEQLRSAVRDREQILAIVAHDLRNPLSSIMLGANTAQLMAGELPGGERLRARLEKLVELTRNMSGLVDDLLAIGVSTSGGKPMLEPQRVSPSVLIEQAYEQARPLYAGTGVELRCEFEPDLPLVLADPQRIGRVLANLLDNALKYTQPPCVVTLAAKADGPVIFSVANSGPALTAEQRQVMFQPFWQAHRTHAGAGLGLPICKSIVEAHGGSIWAEPAEGQRVRICFNVPRLPSEQVLPVAAGAA